MNTNSKGSLASAKVISDLATKNLVAFFPISEHSVVDLITILDGLPIKLQVKFSIDGSVRDKSVYQGKNKIVYKDYHFNDFDFYAIYLSKIDKVIYVPFELGGHEIRFELPEYQANFYWYEDFTGFKAIHFRRKTSEFKDIPFRARPEKRKAMIDKEVLQKLVWLKSKEQIAEEYNVSGSIVSRWCRQENIQCPPRGYWLSQKRA